MTTPTRSATSRRGARSRASGVLPRVRDRGVRPARVRYRRRRPTGRGLELTRGAAPVRGACDRGVPGHGTLAASVEPVLPHGAAARAGTRLEGRARPGRLTDRERGGDARGGAVALRVCGGVAAVGAALIKRPPPASAPRPSSNPTAS